MNRMIVPGMAPVKKTGYMAKLVALLLAHGMQLSSRLQELRDHVLTVPKSKELYDSHRDMMERTGLDHRLMATIANISQSPKHTKEDVFNLWRLNMMVD